MKNYEEVGDNVIYIPQEAPVKVTFAGDKVEVKWSRYPSYGKESAIERINDKLYVVKSTGEVKEYAKSGKRSVGSGIDAANTVRNLFRANVTPDNSHFLTLTYATQPEWQCMSGHTEDFIEKLRRQFDQDVQYIAIPEPQKRNVWHLHMVAVYPDATPSITEYDHWLRYAWGHGRTYSEPIYDTEKLAGYLTKNFYTAEKLAQYPQGMNLYRASSGLVRPREVIMTKQEVDELVANMEQIYKKQSMTTDEETGFRNLHQTLVYAPVKA